MAFRVGAAPKDEELVVEAYARVRVSTDRGVNLHSLPLEEVLLGGFEAQVAAVEGVEMGLATSLFGGSSEDVHVSPDQTSTVAVSPLREHGVALVGMEEVVDSCSPTCLLQGRGSHVRPS